VNAIYEYILATVVVILLVGLTFVNLTSSTFIGIDILNGDQINTVAGEVFNKIILTPGDPVDWNRTNVNSLGLAKVNSTAFTLDRDKVLCLKNGSINGNEAVRLLGLEHLYNFSLSISPALIINVTKISYIAGRHSFNVMVKDLNGLPVSTVVVEGYYVNNTDDWNTGDAIVRNSTTTGINGLATLNFTSKNPKDVVLLITAKSYTTVTLAEFYVPNSSYTSPSTLNPPKALTVQGDYVVEGQPIIGAFTFPSPEPQGVLKTVSLSQFVSIDDYMYEVNFHFWSVSQ
jgi:hypothetical protein